MLIESGSEVTCISEQLYQVLRKNDLFLEMPVANVTIHGAVSSKQTTIKKQIQLLVWIDGQEMRFPFLVIPGLATEIIAGTDWQMHFAMIVDYEEKRIKFCGKYLPDNQVHFFMEPIANVIRYCQYLRINNKLWYNWVEESEIVKDQCLVVSTFYSNEEMGDEKMNDFEHTELDFVEQVEKYVQNLNTLNNDQKVIVTELLLNNRDVFSSEPGCTAIYEHQIKPINNKVFVKKSYPVPLSLRDSVDKEIQRMEKLGVIERSDSPICNPLRVVHKKNGKVRVCLDARWLNKQIQSDNETPE